MKKPIYGLIVLPILLCLATSANTEVNISIGLPTVSVGIGLPVYPQLIVVPDSPVYYAPEVNGNYFFYDGMYWIYQDNGWYASSWYNGPWSFVEPEIVPLFVLQIPVRYYRQPPNYFRGWRQDASPRWGQRWGGEWERQRHGWDRKQHYTEPAPLPVYQREYSGRYYPRPEQQQQLHSQQYHYQPREQKVREHYQQKWNQKHEQQSKEKTHKSKKNHGHDREEDKKHDRDNKH